MHLFLVDGQKVDQKAATNDQKNSRQEMSSDTASLKTLQHQR